LYAEKVGECMVNLNGIAKKLQKAILQKELVIKTGKCQSFEKGFPTHSVRVS
jgi:hypothetical protein